MDYAFNPQFKINPVVTNNKVMTSKAIAPQIRFKHTIEKDEFVKAGDEEPVIIIKSNNPEELKGVRGTIKKIQEIFPLLDPPEIKAAIIEYNQDRKDQKIKRLQLKQQALSSKAENLENEA